MLLSFFHGAWLSEPCLLWAPPTASWPSFPLIANTPPRRRSFALGEISIFLSISRQKGAACRVFDVEETPRSLPTLSVRSQGTRIRMSNLTPSWPGGAEPASTEIYSPAAFCAYLRIYLLLTAWRLRTRELDDQPCPFHECEDSKFPKGEVRMQPAAENDCTGQAAWVFNRSSFKPRRQRS